MRETNGGETMNEGLRIERIHDADRPDVDGRGKAGSEGGWKAIPAAIPGIGAALLPNLTCPACWPAYAGLLSALGLGFVDYTPWLLPLTAGLMGVALLSLGYRARTRGDYRPLFLGTAAAAVLMIGRFSLQSDGVTYAGVALFVGASLWNTLRSRRKDAAPCPSCRPAGPIRITHAPRSDDGRPGKNPGDGPTGPKVERSPEP